MRRIGPRLLALVVPGIAVLAAALAAPVALAQSTLPGTRVFEVEGQDYSTAAQACAAIAKERQLDLVDSRDESPNWLWCELAAPGDHDWRTDQHYGVVRVRCPEHARDAGGDTPTCECDSSYRAAGKACAPVGDESVADAGGADAGATDAAAGEAGAPAGSSGGSGETTGSTAAGKPNGGSGSAASNGGNAGSGSGDKDCPVVYYDKPLSSGGSFGSTKGTCADCGVYLGRVCGVAEDVAVKIYPKSLAGYARNDMAATEAASHTTAGPKFHREVDVSNEPGRVPGRIAFAMEKVPGEMAGEDGENDVDRARHDAAMKTVTKETANQVRQFGDEILALGWYATGDVQGLVDNGRWRPIDFGSYKELPSDAAERKKAETAHHSNVEDEAKVLEKYAAQNGSRP